MANDSKKNKERIKSGITSRQRKGERIRDLHGRSEGASFPSVDPKFEMEPVLPSGSEADPAAPSSDEAASAKADNHAAGSADKRQGKKKKLNTSGVENARGISHEERRRKQNLRDLLKILSAVLCVLLILAAISLFRSFTLVKSINVSGSKVYGEAQLISQSGLSTGKSIFSYSEKDIKAAMDSIPGIHTRSVKKAYPNRIDITVEDITERAAILGANGSYTVISADGYVLSIGSELPEGLTEIRGLTGYAFALNTHIDETDRNIRTVGALELIKAIDEYGCGDLVRSIDLSGAAYTSIELQGGFTAVLGAVNTAHECLPIAIAAYERFLPVYPGGGTINVFNGSSIVDFTPHKP